MVHGDVVIVGGKPRIITDPRMLYVRAAVQGAVVAWTGQMADGSPILVCDTQGRSWRGPTSAFGMQCVGIVPRPDGGWQVTWVLGPTRWARVDLGADLRPIAPVTERDIPRTAGGAQGFLDVELDGEPRWTDTHRMVTLDGHRLYLPLRRGDWTLGQDGEAERLLVYQHATGAVYVAHDGYTPVASRLAVDDRGQPWVLPAGSTTVVGIDQLAPWTPSKPQPKPQPTPEPTPEPEPTPTPAPEPVPEPPRPPYGQATRPDKPIGGNAIADFFRALGRLNVRKWLKDLFR